MNSNPQVLQLMRQIEAQAAELARLREGYSKIQEAGLGGYLTPELVAQITRAALTQPTGD